MVKVYVPDIECDSCSRLISKSLKESKEIKEFSFLKDGVELKGNVNRAIDIITDLGFRASTKPFINKTLSERLRDFFSNKKKYETERRMINYSIASLLITTILGFLFLFVSGFFLKYGWWVFYANVSIVSIAGFLWHLESYKFRLTPMLGMMIGMAVGMQSGMMLGTVFGATNGMVVSAIVMLITSSALGYYSTRNGDIMGILQGVMSAIMGATMGAMLGLMLFTDYILYFMPLFMALNVTVMLLTTFMIYEQVIEEEKIEKEKISFGRFLSYCIIFSLLAYVLIVYGPKTGIMSLI